MNTEHRQRTDFDTFVSMRRAGDHSYAAQNDFIDRGIRADTRTPWAFPNGWDYLSNPEDVFQRRCGRKLCFTLCPA
ncbi:hypothetical protein FNYG_14238 [Fusarium nygamai]|uniref:Uncharacterized protein n=1 Tax=Gibberella nygamai TaxID=42673 RepID=A0A2K0UTP4_GIBNY|nr:hypothetical protein FNYG_14238 [Fusarium nygamai]